MKQLYGTNSKRYVLLKKINYEVGNTVKKDSLARKSDFVLLLNEVGSTRNLLHEDSFWSISLCRTQFLTMQL